MSTMISFRQQLAAISEPPPGKRLSLSGLASYPPSVRQLLRATQNPQPSAWTKELEKEYDSLPTGITCDTVQGFATDGTNWYVPITPGDDRFAVVYKFDGKLETRLAGFNITQYTGVHHHAGDVDFHQGRLYVALEEPAMILVLNEALDTVLEYKKLQGAKPGTPPPSDHNPWCAVNPWNGLLYSSEFDAASRCFAFDPQRDYQHVPERDIVFRGADVKGAQGGKFDGNGHLLMTSKEYRDIRVFSAINGHYLGNCEVDEKPWDELEGLCIWPRKKDDGTPVQIHVASVVVKVTGAIFGGGIGHLYRKGYRVPDFSIMQ